MYHICRFYAGASRHYVELDENATSKSRANFVDSQKKQAAHHQRLTNYSNTGDVTADHVTTGNGQYFVLDAEAVNRETLVSPQLRGAFQWRRHQFQSLVLTMLNMPRRRDKLMLWFSFNIVWILFTDFKSDIRR